MVTETSGNLRNKSNLISSRVGHRASLSYGTSYSNSILLLTLTALLYILNKVHKIEFITFSNDQQRLCFVNSSVWRTQTPLVSVTIGVSLFARSVTEVTECVCGSAPGRLWGCWDTFCHNYHSVPSRWWTPAPVPQWWGCWLQSLSLLKRLYMFHRNINVE